jgi:hypothetical protein
MDVNTNYGEFKSMIKLFQNLNLFKISTYWMGTIDFKQHYSIFNNKNKSKIKNKNGFKVFFIQQNILEFTHNLEN